MDNKIWPFSSYMRNEPKEEYNDYVMNTKMKTDFFPFPNVKKGKKWGKVNKRNKEKENGICFSCEYEC